jgi:hypothetical protein
MALEAQGCVVYWSSSTGHTTNNPVGQLKSFSGPSGSANVIDVSHLGSTAKEKMIGLRDEGQLSLDVLYDGSDTGQKSMRDDRAARTKKAACIKFTDGSSSIAKFKAYCSGFSITGSVDNAITASIQLEITGPVTWTTN